MTAYGPNSGNIAFTGWTNTLQRDPNLPHSELGYVKFNGMTQADGKLSALIRKRSNRALQRYLRTLVGATSGGVATETYKRVAADLIDVGGLRTVETVTQLSDTTNAADVTNVKAAFTRTVFPSTYPADDSGNGGGGKAAY